MKNIMENNYDNLADAVAFRIAFVPMIFGYDSIAPMYFDKLICSRCGYYEQSTDFLVPKSNIKKDYGMFDSLNYGVSIEIKTELINKFDITENDFRPVRNKAGEIVFYQITPQHTMLPITSVNKIKALKPCRKCGRVQYRINEYKNKNGEIYYYILKETLDNLHDLNITFEKFDMWFPLFIVSRRVYEYLISKNPRMRFYPMFLK